LSMWLDQIIRNVPCAAMNGEDGCNFEAHAIYCSSRNGGGIFLVCERILVASRTAAFVPQAGRFGEDLQ
jgi:hypothetical protein